MSPLATDIACAHSFGAYMRRSHNCPKSAATAESPDYLVLLEGPGDLLVLRTVEAAMNLVTLERTVHHRHIIPPHVRDGVTAVQVLDIGELNVNRLGACSGKLGRDHRVSLNDIANQVAVDVAIAAHHDAVPMEWTNTGV